MAKGLRYQHRRNTKLITQFGEVDLDEDGHVTNLDKFNPEDLLTIEGFVDAEVFGEAHPRSRPTATPKTPEPETNHGPSDKDYWELIKELTAKGANLNSEGYIQMEALTTEIRERGWPPISGTRRIRITDEGREAEKAAPVAQAVEANAPTKP